MLDELTSEMKQGALEYRADNHTVAASFEWLYLNYPEAKRYKQNTFEKWCSSVEGKGLYGNILGKVRTAARSESFANKDSRLKAYIEVSMKILEKLRVMDASDAKFSPLSRELRENFKCIKEEVDPFDINDETNRSAFDQLIERTTGTHWEKILNKSLGQTQQTQGN